MFCPHCGGSANEGNDSCSRCGEKIKDTPVSPTAETSPFLSAAEREISRTPGKGESAGSGLAGLMKKGIRLLFSACLIAVALACALDPETGLRQQMNFFTSKPRAISDMAFPSQREQPKTVEYEWSYRGEKYFLAEIFYGNIDAYYKEHPVKSFYEGISKEEYYRNFAVNLEHEKDDTAQRVVRDIRAQGVERGLTEDELVELVVAFVQSIPYDDEKYDVVKNVDESAGGEEIEETWTRFPYEVLYDNKGICTDKSLLTLLLVDELGYGTALFGFDQEEHMAPAIKCTAEYSSYGSGFCYAEVTNTGFRIGDTDVMDIEAGKAVTRSALDYAGTSTAAVPATDALEGFHIYEQKEGKTYTGIIETVATMDRIAVLETEIDAMAPELTALEAGYLELEAAVEQYKRESEKAYSRHLSRRDAASYSEYSRLFKKYSDAYADYERKVDLYNDRAAEYNELAEEYNDLIASFYGGY